MKRGLAGLLAWLVGVASLGSYLPARADSSLQTIPRRTSWQKGGTYRVDVNCDNAGSGKTAYALWELGDPSGLIFQYAKLPDEINNPSQNIDDFFHGFSMENDCNFLTDSVSVRATAGSNCIDEAGLDGPENVNKCLGSFWYKVNSDANPGERSIDIFSHIFLTPENEEQIFSNIPQNVFYIEPTFVGDVNADGSKNEEDVGIFADSLLGIETNPDYLMRCDINDDGKVDGRDIDGFVRAFIRD